MAIIVPQWHLKQLQGEDANVDQGCRTEQGEG